jgi:beta-glucosidase
LSGGQLGILQALAETGKPLIVVLINGKPLSIPWVAENVHAILETFNPGMEGGRAVAALLFGDRNPCGKLPISFPHHVGQQPVYYNQLPGWHGPQKYCDLPREPLFAFGYGLSYTTFAYSDLKLDAETIKPGQQIGVSVDVENTGLRPGSEVVQLYVNDVYSSVTTPIKELKSFQRLPLQPGEKKTIRFELPFETLSIINCQCQRVVEPGEFTIMVGSSSRDEDLMKVSLQVIQ